MKGLFVVLFMIVIDSPIMCARVIRPNAYSSSFNVVDYGAKGDEKTDDSQAFVKAWEKVCGATQDAATLVIPREKTFLLQPVSFKGPCKPTTINIQIQGTITAPQSIEAWKWSNGNSKQYWIQFSGISGLVVNGGGKVDGQGARWWKSNSDAHSKPTALKFNACNNLKLSKLTHINSPRNHISIDGCNHATISSLTIVAPEDSPNTDGLDIASSTNIFINNSTIQTGDDCIAINSGSSFINITGVFCGPGHGISVGSLGKDGAFDTVEEVHVQNCTFNGSTNGARIKTWKGGSGYARKIIFEDIILIGAKNPVIINQQYSELHLGEKNGMQAVKISDVTYRNVKGTVTGKDAIELNCDPIVGCNDIEFDDIYITSEDDNPIEVSCTNAHGTSSSCNPIISCLSH
ncbi:hypothetical protein VNO77_25669 [Canavalia gladiata]|uniref:Polygalacturonase n=1 Tax=Canavalia gladiata TaxID=3824 RepID=A0AAN9QDS0_CANGL